MKKFLKAIATPFVAIFRWVKETAWVQPLLIVGVIFGLIFSIPYIVQGFRGLSSSSTDSLVYYKNHKISMNGAYKGTSDAQKFLNRIDELQTSWYTLSQQEGKSEDEIASARSYVDSFKKDYAEKFFFVLTKSTCDSCEELANGFEYLENNASSLNVEGYKFYSIIADEELSDSADEYKVDSAFKMCYGDGAAFETIFNCGYYGRYKSNLDYSSSEVSGYETKLYSLIGNIEDIEVPLIMLVDLSENSLSFNKDYGYFASEVFFTISGADKIEKAKQLSDCWNYNGKIYGEKA